ncbi:hypothetical protein AOLI_G00040950 [Acnodon oligacanthus]
MRQSKGLAPSLGPWTVQLCPGMWPCVLSSRIRKQARNTCAGVTQQQVGEQTAQHFSLHSPQNSSLSRTAESRVRSAAPCECGGGGVVGFLVFSGAGVFPVKAGLGSLILTE